jgi:hypothetical protein
VREFIAWLTEAAQDPPEGLDCGEPTAALARDSVRRGRRPYRRSVHIIGTVSWSLGPTAAGQPVIGLKLVLLILGADHTQAPGDPDAPHSGSPGSA